jgi:hypothetical protein
MDHGGCRACLQLSECSDLSLAPATKDILKTMTYIPLISATAAILAAIAFEAEANSCTAGSLRTAGSTEGT